MSVNRQFLALNGKQTKNLPEMINLQNLLRLVFVKFANNVLNVWKVCQQCAKCLAIDTRKCCPSDGGKFSSISVGDKIK